jgi:cell division protein FtsI (penicillin-binding protein 3)
VVEPGSTAKAFTIAAALESGKWTPTTRINTSPGWLDLFGHTIRDDSDNGVLDVTGVITKSSNIGAAKIAMSLNPQKMYQVFRAFGFGQSTGSGLPGESAGLLPVGNDWRPIRQATIGYGYGFSVTALQLAQAYCVIADGGVMHAPTFVKNDDNPAHRVIDPRIARQVLGMLKTVVEPGGTAYHTAAIANYTVAGKTGTSHIAEDGGYSDSSYNSLFAGMVPASHPRLVGVVIVRGAQGGYFGSTVAAPVFSAVMKGALRLLDIPPDNVPQLYASRDGVAGEAGAGATSGSAP